MALISCPECANQVSDQAIACNKCGYPISKLNPQHKHASGQVVEEYYSNEFTKIRESNGKYGGAWNWFSFFFTMIWYFFKGCYVQGVVNLLATFIFWQAIPSIREFLNGIAYHHVSDLQLEIFWGSVLAINAGVNGTWHYYNAKILKKQFVSPTSSNLFKTILLIVLVYVLIILYEYIFKSDYYHKGMGSH